MYIKYSLNKTKNSCKSIDSWWPVLITDHLTVRLVWFIANFTKITPNQITIFGFLLGFVSSYCFLQGSYLYLILGAIIYQISFIFDCIDGKLARLKNKKSKFGYFFDSLSDRWKTFFNLLALSYGHFLVTNNAFVLILGFTYCFINLYGIFQIYYEKELKDIIDLKNQKNNTSYKNNSKNIISKTKLIMEKYRLIPGITEIETDAIILFLFPLFNFVKLGFIIGTSLLIFWILVRFIRIFYLIKINNLENE